MRGLPLSLVISVAAHVAIATTLLLPPPRPLDPAQDPSPRIAGDTFELPAPETQEVPAGGSSPPRASEPMAAAAAEGDAPAPPSPLVHARRDKRPSRGGRPPGGRADPGERQAEAPGSVGTSALYGAVGDRSATDFATSFTHAFPQAASGDQAWRSASLGSAGDVDLVVTLDEAGHILHTEIVGAPSPALAGGVRRTLALIKGRPFVAKGRTTKLHLSATVSSDAVHDGLHGDVFAIGKSFAGGEGSAFFALAIGRRVDVRVRAK